MHIIRLPLYRVQNLILGFVICECYASQIQGNYVFIGRNYLIVESYDGSYHSNNEEGFNNFLSLSSHIFLDETVDYGVTAGDIMDRKVLWWIRVASNFITSMVAI